MSDSRMPQNWFVGVAMAAGLLAIIAVSPLAVLVSVVVERVSRRRS